MVVEAHGRGPSPPCSGQGASREPERDAEPGRNFKPPPPAPHTSHPWSFPEVSRISPVSVTCWVLGTKHLTVEPFQTLRVGNSNSGRAFGGSALRGKTDVQLASCVTLTGLRTTRWLVKTFLGVSECVYVHVCPSMFLEEVNTST